MLLVMAAVKVHWWLPTTLLIEVESRSKNECSLLRWDYIFRRTARQSVHLAWSKMTWKGMRTLSIFTALDLADLLGKSANNALDNPRQPVR